MSSRICVRIMGEVQFTYDSPPGNGADQVEAHWSVGRTAMVLVPIKGGEFVGRYCRLLDWFQPDGDPALTVYVFERAASDAPRYLRPSQRTHNA
jgi:hypothetical protein